MANVLVISPTPTHPQDAGNRARIYSLLSGLKKAGHRVGLVFVRIEVGDEEEMAGAWDEYWSIPWACRGASGRKRFHDAVARIFGSHRVVPYGIDDWYGAPISRQLEQIRDRFRPDAVLVEYVFLSKALTLFPPECLRILDTHDIFGERHRLYRQNGMAPQWYYTSEKEEKKALDRADLVLAIQEEEAVYFSRLTGGRVITVGHLPNLPEEDDFPESGEARLLFVGSGNPINVDALKWFLDEVFDSVRRVVPTIELEVVGRCALSMAPREGVSLVGPVPDLASCYRRATVVINPVKFGTGLKIKTIEALSMGRPLVTTSAGAAGLNPSDDGVFLVADTADAFAGAIVRACSSGEVRADLGRNARRFIAEYNRCTIAPLLAAIEKRRSISAEEVRGHG